MNIKNLKPFNLEAALKGEPVMLRNGTKAFVRHHETELSTKMDEILLGYLEGLDLWTWCEDGTSIAHGCVSQYDIIGMYPKTRIINGFEVPAPETKTPKIYHRYFVPCPSEDDFYRASHWDDGKYSSIALQRGLIFLTKEDAIANAKAMLGIDPYEKRDAGGVLITTIGRCGGGSGGGGVE